MLNFSMYPGGKLKAVTFSYDDGMTFDRELVALFNRYGVKGTFHLNASRLDLDRFVTKKEIPTLYRGHEVAGHGLTHPNLPDLPSEEFAHEILGERKILEDACGYPVIGFSYPNGYDSPRLASALGFCGIRYSRTTRSTNGFRPPEDDLFWNPTCHHSAALPLAEEFVKQDSSWNMNRLFYVWGHSYELDGHWDDIENVLRVVAGRDDIWYATNGEICRYREAQRRLTVSADRTLLYNPSAIDVWVAADGKPLCVPAGSSARVPSVG